MLQSSLQRGEAAGSARGLQTDRNPGTGLRSGSPARDLGRPAPVRLAHSNQDWHRLLELCAVTGTLVIDKDGLLRSCRAQRQLGLGMKRTLAQAELHIVRASLTLTARWTSTSARSRPRARKRTGFRLRLAVAGFRSSAYMGSRSRFSRRHGSYLTSSV